MKKLIMVLVIFISESKWVFHGGGATQSMKTEPPNSFGQSHAIHYSEPLNHEEVSSNSAHIKRSDLK